MSGLRRYVLTAEQQAVVLTALRAALMATCKHQKEFGPDAEDADKVEAHRLGVGELLPLFAEGGVECNGDGEEINW